MVNYHISLLLDRILVYLLHVRFSEKLAESLKYLLLVLSREKGGGKLVYRKHIIIF